MRTQDTIRSEVYQHEKDKKLISELMRHPVAEQIFQWIRDQNIDEIYTYVYEESCIRLTRENALGVIQCLERVCALLGCQEVPRIYLIHDYNRTIEICGVSRPIILVSSYYLKLLKWEGERMLTGILGGQIAAICVGHHRGLLLRWAMDMVLQQVSLPKAAVTALRGLLNDWQRCRIYTCDRAFFVLTRDYPLALRSIFLMRLPKEIMDGFRLGTQNDLYRDQVRRFLSADGLDHLINMYNSATTDQSWLPLRYEELEKFYQKTRQIEVGKTNGRLRLSGGKDSSA